MLTKQQKEELFSELQIEREKKFADRIRVILLLDQGKPVNQIARFLFLNETTIRKHKNRYLEGGIEKLLNDHYVGRSCFLSEGQQNLLIKELDSKIVFTGLFTEFESHRFVIAVNNNDTFIFFSP